MVSTKSVINAQLLALLAISPPAHGYVRRDVELPPQVVSMDPRSFAVLSGTDVPFRNSSFTTFFNPTSTQPPFFQVSDSPFLDILGPNAIIYQAPSNDSFPYAHEAPIYYSETDDVFFASNTASDPLDFNNQVAKISMKEDEKKLVNATIGTVVNVTVTELNLPDSLQNTNGGTGPYYSNLLFTNPGRGPLLVPTVTLVNLRAMGASFSCWSTRSSLHL